MARPTLGESETERLHLKITADEVKAIDDWRYANRVPSRSEAVRRLVRMALAFEEGRNDLLEGFRSLASAIEATSSAAVPVLEYVEQTRSGPTDVSLDLALALVAEMEQNLKFSLLLSSVLQPINSYRSSKHTIDDAVASVERVQRLLKGSIEKMERLNSGAQE